MITYTSPLPVLRGYTFSDDNDAWYDYGGRMKTHKDETGYYVSIKGTKWYFDDILQSAKDAGYV